MLQKEVKSGEILMLSWEDTNEPHNEGRVACDNVSGAIRVDEPLNGSLMEEAHLNPSPNDFNNIRIEEVDQGDPEVGPSFSSLIINVEDESMCSEGTLVPETQFSLGM